MEDIITVDTNTQDSNNLLIQQPILLQTSDNSKNQPQEQNQIKKSSNLDDLPIGGGKKFMISEYPDQNAPVKTTKKNINNKKKKPQSNQALPINEQKVLTQLNNFDQKPIQGTNTNSFDQKPIGKTNFTLSQFPQGQQIPEEKPVNLTLQQKLKSKTVKIRMDGFLELNGLLNTNPITEPPLNELQFDKFLKQTNPGCLQKILMCFQLWVNKQGNWGDQQIKLLIQNGYINGKGTSKKISSQLVDYMYQKKSAQVEQAILNGLKGKTLKIVAGYITLINQLLSIYGIKKMNFLKPYYPDVIRLISNQKLPIIKTEGMTMLKEALKWLGKPFLEPYFKANNLKQGLSKQIDQFWQTYDKKIVMNAPKQQEKFCEVDIFKMSEQIDIFKKYNQKWVENVLKIQKWKQKCDMMQQLVKEASIPKISNKQHRHIGDLVKRLIQDSNFNVVLVILKILGAISQGLRKPFSPIVKNNFRNVINKFKDKKTLMIDQTNNCLNQFYYVITLQQVIDDVKEGLSDKNPNMKMHLIAWIERYIDRKINQKALNEKGKQAIRSLIPNFQKLCNDGVAEVRQSSLKALSKMKANLGQNFFSALQTKLGKTFNFVAKQSKQSKKQEKVEVKIQVKQQQKPSANTMKQNAFKSVNSIPKAQKKVEEKIQDYEVPTYQQCCQSLLQQGFTQQDFKIVTGNVPKQKTQFLQGLSDRITENNFEAIIKILRKMFKQWKQSNLVMNKQLFNFLLTNVQKINKRQYVIVLPFLLEKLGDSKFSEPLKGITEVFCQKIPPKFLVNQILKYLKPTQTKKITPKLNNQSCIFLADLIDKVSLNYLPFKELLELSRECFQVVLSKKGATALIKKIYEYMGEPMKACLDEAIAKSLDAQLKKIVVLSEQEKKPKVTFRGQALQQVKGQKIVNPLQTLPRVDISNDIIRFMSKLNDQANWQSRKQALEGLDNLLSQNKNRIQLTGLSELISSLKNRISDSNKQVTKTSISFTSHLIQSVGKQIKSQSKILIYALIEILSDKNEIIRKDVVQSLTKIGQVLGMQWVISCMGGSLETDKIELRLQILNFIIANEQFLLKVELKQFTKGIINGLCDKNKDIRNLSQKILEKTLQKVNLQVYRSIAKDFRPAFMKDLTLLFDKFDKNSSSINLSTIANYNSVKGTSPARSIIQQQMKKPPISSKKQQLQPNPNVNNNSNNNNTSILLTRNLTQKNLIQKQSIQNNYSTYFQGDQPLANIKFLSNFRQMRQQQDQQVPWNHQSIKQGKQQQLIQQINKIFRKDIASKMVSLNYKNTVQASANISKLCRDMALHNSFRQIYDVILKWIFLKIWGGNASVSILIEILPPLLSILEKKSLIINQNEVLLIIGIIRQQFIGMYPENKFNEGIYTIIKCLLKLNSGQRVLKLILNQFVVDLCQIHKHLKKQVNNYYRQCLGKIIKSNLMDFVGSQQFLSDISKIQSLSRDPEFIQMLYQRFNQNGLNGYGFKRQVLQNNIKIINPNLPQQNLNPNQSLNINLNTHPNNQLNSSFLGGSQINQPMKETKIDNRRPPVQALLPKTDSQTHLSQFPNISINNVPINKNNNSVYPQQLSLYQRLLKLQNFPYPPTSNPLCEHLSKLYPPEETTVNFFQTLFNQQSEKILSELQLFSKCILIAILKGTIDLLNKRSEYGHQKISTQLNLLQKALLSKQIIRNSGEVLGIATEFVLKQLIFEDQNKAMISESFKQRGIDVKPDIFIKTINGIMLRILQNAHPHQIVLILFDLLIKNLKKQQVSQKTLSLILKCLNRVSNSYMNQFEQNNLKELFLKFHQYNIQLQAKLKPQDQGLSIIKNMLTLISKQIKENVWIHYQRSMKDSNMADNFIHKYLQSLNIPYPQKPKPSQKQQQLKKITELLAKLKTYDSGIVLLNSFLDKNPEFQIAQYFSSLNYQNKFIGKVLNSLENNFKRPPPRTVLPERPEKKSQERKYNNNLEMKSTEQNYIQKIKNLRQKFDQINQVQKMEEQHHQHHTPVVQKEQQPDPDRASQIRRRITEMKAKIHNVIK